LSPQLFPPGVFTPSAMSERCQTHAAIPAFGRMLGFVAAGPESPFLYTGDDVAAAARLLSRCNTMAETELVLRTRVCGWWGTPTAHTRVAAYYAAVHNELCERAHAPDYAAQGRVESILRHWIQNTSYAIFQVQSRLTVPGVRRLTSAGRR
jgi:hypothetical protein